MPIDILWAAERNTGLEHLHFQQSAAGVKANGLVIGLLDDAPFRLRYAIQTDADWRVRRVDVAALFPVSRDVSLRADGDGHWTNASGEVISALDGCLDVDIMTTPFTNTLPIRRLGLRSDESAEIDVVYVRVPDLSFSRVRQRYTCLQQEPGGAIYRYEGLVSGFTADITVDRDGLVIDYPGVWRRAWSRGQQPEQ